MKIDFFFNGNMSNHQCIQSPVQAIVSDYIGFRNATKRNLKIVIGLVGFTDRKMTAGFFETGDFSRFVKRLCALRQLAVAFEVTRERIQRR